MNMIRKFAIKYFIILPIAYLLLVFILTYFIPVIAWKLRSTDIYESMSERLSLAISRLIPNIVNLVIAFFLLIDTKKLGIKDLGINILIIPILSLLNPLSAICMLGLLIVNNNSNSIKNDR